MAKKKFYAVRRGRQIGVFTTWAECQRQTVGFSGADFKSFPSVEAAEAWIDSAGEPVAGGDVPTGGIAVDGACSGNPGPMEYRGVDIATGETLFSAGPFEGGTNNIAEFLAIVDAARLIAAGEHEGPIWTDSRTATTWIEKGRANSTADRKRMDPALAVLIADAERWLAGRGAAAGPLPLRKWDTDAWGEVPADYGRKG